MRKATQAQSTTYRANAPYTLEPATRGTRFCPSLSSTQVKMPSTKEPAASSSSCLEQIKLVLPIHLRVLPKQTTIFVDLLDRCNSSSFPEIMPSKIYVSRHTFSQGFVASRDGDDVTYACPNAISRGIPGT